MADGAVAKRDRDSGVFTSPFESDFAGVSSLFATLEKFRTKNKKIEEVKDEESPLRQNLNFDENLSLENELNPDHNTLAEDEHVWVRDKHQEMSQ